MFELVMKRWESVIRSFFPSRATDKVQVRVDGYDSDRVLLLGDGAAVGWGVDSQDDALLGNLASELSTLSGRGTTVDLVADPFMTAERAASLVQDLLVWRYDYVFITLGMTDATRLNTANAWRRELSKLLALLSDELAVSAQIVVANIPPIADIKQITWPFSTIIGRRVEALNEATVELCADLPRVRFVEVAPANPSAMKNSYSILAAQLAAALSRVLNDETHIEGVRHRQRPDVTSLAGEAPDGNIGRVGELVQRAFHLENAAVAVLEGDRQWRIGSSGAGLEATQRSTVLDESSLRSDDVIIVRDTRKDPRFLRKPPVAGDSDIRFYAGFPIESPLGVRVGNLCVTHGARQLKGNDVDVVALRQLAKIALVDLWRYLPPQHEPRDGRR